MKVEKIGKIQNFLMFLTCVLLIVGLVLTNTKTKEKKHDVTDIKISISDISTSTEDAFYSTRYFVTIDFKIENNSKANADLQYLEITTYLTDKNGKSLGTITSSFGSSYSSSSDFKVGNGESKIVSSYLDVVGSNWNNLFTELYNNGLNNCNVEHEITYARWTDDYTWDIDN